MFAYTIVMLTRDAKGNSDFAECSGVMSATSPEEVSFILGKLGYCVRDIRLARPEDIRLMKFQKMKRKLSGEKEMVVTEKDVVEVFKPQRQNRRWLWVCFVLLILGVILWRILL